MREEQLLSVGIDIGTSTTQCVFSRLTLHNTASAFSVPRVRITNKTILYRSPVCLTPLLHQEIIDANALESIIRKAYADAHIQPADIQLGAIIITGETARKSNAQAVVNALSELAGDFVVATAGPALESILAGRGSGASELSEEKGRSVLNLDIGGGTTNMALFSGGIPRCDGCLNIGGRLLCFDTDDHTVLSFTPFIAAVAKDVSIVLREGQYLSDEQICLLARRMAEVLEEAAGLRERSALHDALIVEHSLPKDIVADIFTFSGGVADCIYNPTPHENSFHDLGEALGKALAKSRFFTSQRVVRPLETSHATVIGAGAYSMTVSGSTIQFRNMRFPIKSLPIGCVPFTQESDIARLGEEIALQYDIFEGECAIYMEGISSISYDMLKRAAAQIATAMQGHPLKVLIFKEDMAKALGQALSRHWSPEVSFLCLDGIELMYGDTIDIGTPLNGDRVVPVIVKTFAFSQATRR